MEKIKVSLKQLIEKKLAKDGKNSHKGYLYRKSWGQYYI